MAGTGDVSPTTAKALLGVGIATLVIGLAIAVAGFMLFRKARREKLWAVSDDAGSQSAYSGHVQNDHDTTKAS